MGAAAGLFPVERSADMVVEVEVRKRKVVREELSRGDGEGEEEEEAKGGRGQGEEGAARARAKGSKLKNWPRARARSACQEPLLNLFQEPRGRRLALTMILTRQRAPTSSSQNSHVRLLVPNSTAAATNVDGGLQRCGDAILFHPNATRGSLVYRSIPSRESDVWLSYRST